MDIQTEKLDLIQWLAQLTDETVVAKIAAVRNEKADWWDKISDEEKIEIKEAIAQAEANETTPHEIMRKKFEKWL